MGFQSILSDLGMKATITLFIVSSAARGIIHRAGLGKLWHLETGYLWLQAAVKNKRLQVRKVSGTTKSGRLVHEAPRRGRDVEAFSQAGYRPGGCSVYSCARNLAYRGLCCTVGWLSLKKRCVYVALLDILSVIMSTLLLSLWE